MWRCQQCVSEEGLEAARIKGPSDIRGGPGGGQDHEPQDIRGGSGGRQDHEPQDIGGGSGGRQDHGAPDLGQDSRGAFLGQMVDEAFNSTFREMFAARSTRMLIAVGGVVELGTSTEVL